MSGSYGWNISGIESYGSENESSSEEENASAPSLDFSHPQIKGCCFCCCVEDEDEITQNPVEQQGKVEMDPKGFYWCEYTGSLPETAVKAGVDKDGGYIYVGRAVHEGEMQPAKVVPNHGCAYISFGGAEECKNEFEVLCRGSCRVIWQECRDGAVPPEAVSGGVTADEERLYIGRVFYDGTHIPGKVHPSHGCCYVAYGGEELNFQNYEVLILQ